MVRFHNEQTHPTSSRYAVNCYAANSNWFYYGRSDLYSLRYNFVGEKPHCLQYLQLWNTSINKNKIIQASLDICILANICADHT